MSIYENKIQRKKNQPYSIIVCVLCEQRVKQIYENLEEELPVYFYVESGADAIGVNCEESTWPLENSGHQV